MESPIAEPNQAQDTSPGISLTLNLILAFAGCVSVQNNYFLQPILPTLRDYFGVSESSAGSLQALVQGGFSVGMLLYIPAGDVWPKRSLLLFQFGVLMVAVLAQGLMRANMFPLFQFFCLLVGWGTAVNDLIKPFAMSLSTKDQSGQVLGIILGGFYLGMMIARVLSGIIGQYWAWQGLFLVHTGVQVATIILLWFTLPRRTQVADHSTTRQKLVAYVTNVAKVITQFFSLPALRNACLMTFFGFVQLNSYLVAVSFLLTSPVYGYKTSIVGYLAFASIITTLQSPNTGRLADRIGPYNIVPLGFVVSLLAWTLLITAGQRHIVAIIVGGVLIDLGNQFNHMPQNLRVFRHTQLPGLESAGSRLNATYMIFVFAGGSLGSVVGSNTWSRGGWNLVCYVGFAISSVMALIWLLFDEKGSVRSVSGMHDAIVGLVTGKNFRAISAKSKGLGLKSDQESEVA
ncbi:MFS general substrate transporter [Gonapodya prolifera JEL478]|uniref:MFS general substrate transporter n=1 Tax=Gonapodya prolifera (strain JEL478) TaxID=1344416 RepID=A0A139AFX0_GONPJ|nr:MFS general substrate transporter [Gonapodya prolifera JEL478]|eukprot:KXS15722.1 MFS general substrate transporter [Gonapodya prolifera JEL478]